MEPKYQKVVHLTDVHEYHLNVVDVFANKEYREATKQVAEMLGINIPDWQYEISVMLMVDGYEVGSHHNQRMENYVEAKKLVNYISTLIINNKEALLKKGWAFDQTIINFLLNHRN